jgi:hypothetical protein
MHEEAMYHDTPPPTGARCDGSYWDSNGDLQMCALMTDESDCDAASKAVHEPAATCTYAAAPTPANQPESLFRVEYRTGSRGLQRFWGLQDADMPCVVCQSIGSSAVMMQPGSTKCPSGWSNEYKGYIFSSETATTRGEYICVDSDSGAAVYEQVTISVDPCSNPQHNDEEDCTSDDGIWRPSTHSASGWAGAYQLHTSDGAILPDGGVSGSYYNNGDKRIAWNTVEATWELYTNTGGSAGGVVAKCGDVLQTEAGSTECDIWILFADASAVGTTAIVFSIDSEHVESQKAARIAPVEMMRSQGDILSYRSYPAYVEQMCAVCSQPQPSLRCPKLVAPGNGSVTCNNMNRYASACVYSCKRGFLLEGPEMLLCLASEEWTHAPTTRCVQPAEVASHVYTHWGSYRCDDLSETLYVGAMVGPDRSDAGSGSNYLCLATPHEQAYSNNGYNGGGKLWSAEWTTNSYNNIFGFDHLHALNGFEIPCSVCVRRRSVGYQMWGSDQCPGEDQRAFAGYIMGDTSQRNSYACVEKQNPTVARQPCPEIFICPASSTVTSFRFETDWNGFISSTTGPVGGTEGSGWAWQATRGDHDGIVERTVDGATEASIFTSCSFDTICANILLRSLFDRTSLFAHLFSSRF